jgi:alpha-beta hydrolase superfamily lysophospholipase
MRVAPSAVAASRNPEGKGTPDQGVRRIVQAPAPSGSAVDAKALPPSTAQRKLAAFEAPAPRQARAPSGEVSRITVAGKVAGEFMPPGRAEIEHFRPPWPTAPSGKIIVIVPGIGEEPASWQERIAELNRLGHGVIRLDPAWNKKRSLFAAARDVAAVGAFAAHLLESDPAYSANTPGREVLLYGHGFGATAALAAAALRDHGTLYLSPSEFQKNGRPRQLPAGIKVLADAPEFDAPSTASQLLAGAKAKLPFVGRRDPAQEAAAIRAASETNLQLLSNVIAGGAGPTGAVVIAGGEPSSMAKLLPGFASVECTAGGSPLDHLERLANGQLVPGTFISPSPGLIERGVAKFEAAVADRFSDGIRAALRDGGTASHIGWLRAEPTTVDRNEDFWALLGAAQAGRPILPAEAKDHVVLLVKGLFTEHYPGYFTQTVAHLKGLGVEARLAAIDTDAGVEANVKALVDEVLRAAAEGKKVVFYGHSKGGVDASALLALYPGLRDCVRANVSLLAPYGGTPIAEDIEGSPRFQRFANTVIERLLRGDSAALGDLTYRARMAFISAHPYPTEVPTLSVTGSTEEVRSLTSPVQVYMQERYGVPSDGLVVPSDALIPHSHHVHLPGLDHAGGAMMPIFGEPVLDPGILSEVLLALALGIRAPAANRPG